MPDKTLFVVLFSERDVASGIIRRLQARLSASTSKMVKFLLPPVRGVDFFTVDDEDLQEELDGWWAENDEEGAEHVFLVPYSPEVVSWLDGLDGTIYLCGEVGEETGLSDNVTQLSEDPDDIVEQIVADMEELFSAGDEDDEEDADVPPVEHEGDTPDKDAGAEEDDSERMSSLEKLRSLGILRNFSDDDFTRPEGDEEEEEEDDDEEDDDDDDEDVDVEEDPDDDEAPTPVHFPGRHQPGGPFMPKHQAPHLVTKEKAAPEPILPIQGPNPFDALVASVGLQNRYEAVERSLFNVLPNLSPTESQAGPVIVQPPKSRGFSLPQVNLENFLGRFGRGRGGPEPRELGNLLKDKGPLVILVASRAGGVGKTITAGALGFNLGEVASSIGGKTALADFNLTNPDAWGYFDVSQDAATVRQVIRAIGPGGGEPPEPEYAKSKDGRGTNLAVYPADRAAADYSQTEIDRLADYFKRRYLAIVIDLANHLPGAGDPAGEAVAYWLEHADVLVLPTTGARKAFTGVAEYLDLKGLPPVVVPYIPSPDKGVRKQPFTQVFLSNIIKKVYGVVEIPFEPKVDVADYDATPIVDITTALRDAYWRLTEMVIKAAEERR